MKIPLLTQSGELNSMSVDIDTVAMKVNRELIQQAVVTELANERMPHGHSRTRGTVRGGGRKPWRQKGTGRARHSSVRSPIWTGGGIAFGPKSDQNFHKALPKMMRANAFRMALNVKLTAGALTVIEQWPHDQQTKSMNQLVGQAAPTARRILMIFDTFDQPGVVAARNLVKTTLSTPMSVRTSDLINADVILIDKAAFDQLTKRVAGRLATKLPQVAPVVTEAK